MSIIINYTHQTGSDRTISSTGMLRRFFLQIGQV
jgi:hypothetical protein